MRLLYCQYSCKQINSVLQRTDREKVAADTINSFFRLGIVSNKAIKRVYCLCEFGPEQEEQTLEVIPAYVLM